MFIKKNRKKFFYVTPTKNEGGGVRAERTFQVKIRFFLIDTLPNMCEVLVGFYKKIPLSFMDGGGVYRGRIVPY